MVWILLSYLISQVDTSLSKKKKKKLRSQPNNDLLVVTRAC